MRKIVAGFACSVDGYIEGSQGEYDWIIIDKEIDFSEQMKRYDTFLFGRKTYEAVLQMGSRPAPGVKNYVFSNTLQSVDKHYILVKGPVDEEMNAIKQQGGKDIAVFGGALLLASLLDHKLVDEINISFIPVLIGSGKPMVSLLKERVWLTYISSKAYSNGTLKVQYNVRYTPG